MNENLLPCASGNRWNGNGFAHERHQCPICLQSIHAICGVESQEYEADHIKHGRTCYYCAEKEVSSNNDSDISFPSSDANSCPDDLDTVSKSCSSETISPLFESEECMLESIEQNEDEEVGIDSLCMMFEHVRVRSDRRLMSDSSEMDTEGEVDNEDVVDLGGQFCNPFPWENDTDNFDNLKDCYLTKEDPKELEEPSSEQWEDVIPSMDNTLITIEKSKVKHGLGHKKRRFILKCAFKS